MEELLKLEIWLKENGYVFSRTDETNIAGTAREAHQIIVYKIDNQIDSRVRSWDVIYSTGSYGYEDGLLEIYGDIVDPDAGDSVEGWLTANDIIKRLERKR